MIIPVSLFLGTCLFMILAVLYFPTIKLGKISLDTYPLITLLGALLLISTGSVSLSEIMAAFTADTAVNPLKILLLFICMTVLSIYLDELGFFRYLADVTLKRAGKSQMRLFLYLYLTVSVLTVFTSNDIIILSFTPFICYFAKSAGIDPIPYLAAEFVAANTWSMALVIGNPTNIYLSTAYGIGFFDYLRVMILPTVVAGAVAFMILYVLFHKSLCQPTHGAENKGIKIEDRLSLYIGVGHLALCTAALAVGPYMGLEMWLVALVAVVSLSIFASGISLARHRVPTDLTHSLRRAPWQLVPFMLSMFVLVIAVSKAGATEVIAKFLEGEGGVAKYGIASFLSANLINNIPMSVLFSSVIEHAEAERSLGDMYATVVGSNIGAFLTPIGALAGIMWSGILKGQGIKFGYRDFLKIGVTVAIPTILSALITLSIIL